MNASTVRDRCEALASVTSYYPFGPGVEVYRVGDKMFALLDDASVSLKCDPALAEVLRANFPAITPGYHLNKRHWNSIALDGTVPDHQIADLIQHSHGLVLASLTKKERARILE